MMPKKRFKKFTQSEKEQWKKDKRADVKNLLARVEQGVSEISTSEEWAEMLKFMGNFRSYSFNNRILIFLQKPCATRVAGFNAWGKLGRRVKKGEKALRILAPVPVKYKAENDQGEEEERGHVGFRSIGVFDVSQTEGDDLPGDSIVELLEGNTPRAYDAWDRGMKVAANLGFTVDVADTIADFPSANGVCRYGDKSIEIKDQDKVQMAKSLFHEIAHANMHGDLGGYEEVHSRAQAEIEAESVAFCIMNILGLESSSYSFGYVAGWSGGDSSKVMESSEAIHKCVADILEVIESDESDRKAA
jgi:antirestriction protein ArdC